MSGEEWGRRGEEQWKGLYEGRRRGEGERKRGEIMRGG